MRGGREFEDRGYEDPRFALRRLGLDGVAERAAATRERFEAVDGAVAALRVTRAHGAAEVTVDGRGALVDVRFSPGFRSAEAEDLAGSVLRALHAAQAALPDLVATLVADDPAADTARALVEGYRRRFPATSPVSPPDQPDPPPSSSHTWLR